MDRPAESVRSDAPSSFESDPAATAPLDAAQSHDLHRAINERRAQLEDGEMLRRLRAL